MILMKEEYLLLLPLRRGGGEEVLILMKEEYLQLVPLRRRGSEEVLILMKEGVFATCSSQEGRQGRSFKGLIFVKKSIHDFSPTPLFLSGW